MRYVFGVTPCGKTDLEHPMHRSEIEYVNKWLKKAQRDASRIEHKIDAKAGVFSRYHLYSTEELSLQVTHLESLVSKILSDTRSWVKFDNISHAGLQKVSQDLNSMASKLEFLQTRIKLRRATLWERVKEPFIRIVQKIGSLFGLLPSGYISGVKTLLFLTKQDD